jgi:predicted nucleic acid-binding protein
VPSEEQRRAGVRQRLQHVHAPFVVFDATVPLYFAKAGRAPLLANMFRDRAHIPKAVFNELYGLTASHPHASLLVRPKCFARIVTLDEAELAARDKRQRAWVGEDTWLKDPLKNRGEAECLELSLRKDRCPIVLHDHQGVNDARVDRIPVVNAVDIAAVAALDSTENEGWALYLSLLRAGMRQVGPIDKGPSGRAQFASILWRAR